MRRKGLKRRKNISKRILTSKKKRQVVKKNQGPKSEMLNKGMSLKENFQNMGIMININKEIDKALKNEQPKEKVAVEEEVDISALKNGTVSLKPLKTRKRLMNIDDKWIVEEMLRKYGDDIKKMFKDTKVNKFQWNKTQIGKKIEDYKLNFGEYTGFKKK